MIEQNELNLEPLKTPDTGLVNITEDENKPLFETTMTETTTESETGTEPQPTIKKEKKKNTETPADDKNSTQPEEDIKLDTMEGKMAFIESILFVSKEPLEPAKIMSYLGIKYIREFEKIMDRLEESYKTSNRGIFIKRTGGGLQLTTKPAMNDYLQDYFSIKSSSRLTIPSLETLSIIAYRQPVTIAEISDLRGVNSTGPIKNLLQKKLIKITGRKKVPGLPALYSTTKEFLLYFGLNDLTELPSLEELTEMFEEKEQPSLFAI